MAVRAILFDVFGTCVDWRSSVARDVATVWPDIDANQFACDWRAEYDPAMARIRSGNRGYVRLDQLHRENLDRVCAAYQRQPPDGEWLNKAWERLDPWADVREGLLALKKDHILAPCSNGSIALMTRLARWAELPWDCILGADLARNYKPHPSVYQAAVDALGLTPDEVMMVAAHNADLFGAREAGLATGFVARPTEYSQNQTKDLGPEAAWDYVAADFIELAAKL